MFLWMRTLALTAMLGSLAASGCLRSAEFRCGSNADCLRSGVEGVCEAVGYCSFPDGACATGRRFADISGAYSNQCIDESPLDAGIDTMIDAPPDAPTIPSACSIPSSAQLAWELVLPTNAFYALQSEVPYAIDNRTALANTSFTRVGYCLQLDTSFVYVELDDFTAGDVQATGLPTDMVFDTAVTRLTIRTNVTTLTEATLATGGAIELWSNCYSAGLNAVYDYDDDIGGTDCYGSLQVHHGTTTALAYNRWAQNSGDDDVGIGNQPAGNPDWTFAQTAGGYTTRKLQAVILP